MRTANHSSRFIELFRDGAYQNVPLGELCSKITDGSHNPPKGVDASKFLMISSQNVFSDGLDLSDVRYLSKEDFENEDKRTSVSKGDVLLTIVGTIGRVYQVTGTEGPIALQRSVAVLKPNDKISSRFLMVSFLYDDDFSKEGRGNAQKGVYLKQLSQYMIKLPSAEKQKEFEVIYQQAEKSKFSDFKSRFIEMFEGDKFQKVRLGDYTDLTWGDTNTTKNSYVPEGYLAFSAGGPDGKLDHYDYDREGIVLSAIGADCGKTWYTTGKWSCIKNTIRFWSTSEKLDNYFLFLATRDKDYWPRRGGAQPFIPQTDARNCVIPLPPIDLQRQFISLANQADKSKYLN